MIKKFEIQLKYPFLYQWKQHENISVITNSDAGQYFKLFESITTESDAFDVLEKVDGNFAVVINNEDYFLAAVDRVRGFPLLYKIEPENIFLTDDIAQVEKEFDFNDKAVTTFKHLYCTEGSETLLQNWKQLSPGEYLFIDKVTGQLSVKKYFRFRKKLPGYSINPVILKEIFLNVFRSILSQIGDRPIIVPLSAGYDSRCIVAVLMELNAGNVFCYTYGRSDSFEKEVAQKVAHQLNLEWQFIEYTNELLDLFFASAWKKFSDKNHFFTSLPNEQDFFALWYLKDNNLLPENGVVLSGYLGGALAGNRNHFPGVPFNDDDQEEFNYDNRGSKFIVNSIRLYEYFGLHWYMPFVAGALIDYSLHIPIKERFYENGYHDFLSEVFFKPLNIDFKKQDHYFKKNRFKIFLKKYLPGKLVKWIQFKNSSTHINDPNNTRYLQQKIEISLYGKLAKKELTHFNKFYAEYFLKELRKDASAFNLNPNN